MKNELIQISKLKLLDSNPRTITKDQMQKLCKSIQDDPDFLNCRPVLVNKTCVYPILNVQDEKDYKRIDTLTVYAGNQRVRAAKKLKMKEIPCIVENDLCPEVMKKRTVLDNSSFGAWDFDMLANEYDIEMLLDCGFNAEEILGDLSDTIGEDIKEDKEEQKVCDKCGSKIKK